MTKIFVQSGQGNHISVWPEPDLWQSYIALSTQRRSPPNQLCYIEDVDLNIDTEVYPLFRRLILSLLLSTMMWTGTLLHDVCGLPVANFSQAIFSKLALQQADSDELLTDNSNNHQQASKPAGCPSHRHSPWVDSEPGDLTTDEAVALLISTLQIAFYVHCGDPPQKQIIASALPVAPNHGKCEIYIAYQSLLI